MSITKQNIKTMQSALKDAGFYSDVVDGIAGNNTVNAVKAAASAAKADVPTVSAPVAPTVEQELPRLANYMLSERSLQRMNGIKSNLRDVVRLAIQISEVDFMVVEGLRSRETQAKYVASGASQTHNSKHLTGDAVDIVPLENGVADWGDKNNWANIFKMAAAMQQAANELNIRIIWGGAWVLINNKSGTPYQWVEQYKADKRKQGKKAFMDGVHFELA